MIFIGVDVGVNGGIAFVDDAGHYVHAVRMPETDMDVFEVFPRGEVIPARAVLEKVHSSPQMGVASAFAFGAGYGRLRMALTAAHVPFDEVTPFKWQRRMECLSGGNKNVTKARAQQLFPGAKITHAIADALILAEFCRRSYLALP